MWYSQVKLRSHFSVIHQWGKRSVPIQLEGHADSNEENICHWHKIPLTRSSAAETVIKTWIGLKSQTLVYIWTSQLEKKNILNPFTWSVWVNHTDCSHHWTDSGLLCGVCVCVCFCARVLEVCGSEKIHKPCPPERHNSFQAGCNNLFCVCVLVGWYVCVCEGVFSTQPDIDGSRRSSIVRTIMVYNSL